jgi:hypothetical protein
MNRRGFVWAGALLLGASFHCGAAVENIIERFEGTARTEDGKLAYVESHRVEFQHGRHVSSTTQYINRHGDTFAELVSRYDGHRYVPTYAFRDNRFGRESGVSVAADQVRFYGRKDKSEQRREDVARLAANMTAGQGLNFYVRDHLEAFAASSAVRKPTFLMPLAGQQVTFRMRRLEPDTGANDTITVRIEADNWLFRLFAPHLEVTYNLTTRRLLSYRGPSNILNADRDVQNVQITYTYEPGGVSVAARDTRTNESEPKL